MISARRGIKEIDMLKTLTRPDHFQMHTGTKAALPFPTEEYQRRLTGLRGAASRVADAERSFGAKATKAVGDSDLDEMEANREETRRQIEELQGKQQEGERTIANLRDSLAKQRERLGDRLHLPHRPRDRDQLFPVCPDR